MPGIILRDIVTGIRAANGNAISTHGMRHLWTAPDGTILLVIQQGGIDGHYLCTWESRDQGATWQRGVDIDSDPGAIADGVMDTDGNVRLVTSAFLDTAVANVTYRTLIYDTVARRWWPGASELIFASTASDYATLATLALGDGMACAVRINEGGQWYIRVYRSLDDGATWQNETVLGIVNAFDQKVPRMLWAGAFVVVFQDQESASARYKRVAVRTATGYWQQVTLGQMGASADPRGTHWSATVDASGLVHLSYQDGTDGYGIKYATFNPASMMWGLPNVLTVQGQYSNVATDGTTVTVIRDHPQTTSGKRLYGRVYKPTAWSAWYMISGLTYVNAPARLCCPERFVRYLPTLHSAIYAGSVHHMIFNLLDAE